MSMRFTLGVFLWVHLLASWVHADTSLKTIPDYHAHVTDMARVLSAADRVALEKQLADFETQHGSQIEVLIVPSTGQEDITEYTQRVGDRWKLGRQGVGDGLLVVVAVNDHRVRIAPYRALEAAIPDVLAKRIIDKNMVPAFRQGDYAGGLRDALQSLQTAILSGEQPVATGSEASQKTWEAQIQKIWENFVGPALVAGFLAFLGLSAIRQFLSRFFSQSLAALITAVLGAMVCWRLSSNVWFSGLILVLGYFSRLKYESHNRPISRESGHGVFRSGNTDSQPEAISGGGGDSAGGGASGRW